MAYNDQQIADYAKQLAAAGASSDEIEKFVSSAKASQGGYISQPANAPTAQSPEALAKKEAQQAGIIPIGREDYGNLKNQYIGDIPKFPTGAVVDMGLEAGGATLGQAAGVPLAPVTGGLSIPVLGALGAGAGNALGQTRRMISGEQAKPNWGQLGGAMTMGAIPGVSQGAGLAGFAKSAGIYGAGNLAAKTVETGINEGKLPSAGQAAMALGSGVLGAAGQKILGSATSAAMNADQKLNLVRDSRFRDLRSEGVVVPPADIGAGSDTLSSLAGKAALAQQASKTNQAAWQRMAREDLGLSSEAVPFHEGDVVNKIPSTFDEVRAKAYQPYEEAAKVSPKVAKDLEILREERANLQQAYNAYKNGGPRDDYERAKNTVNALNDAIDKAAVDAGKPDLLPRLNEARKRIAQSYAIENATNKGNGFVDPSQLAMQLNAGVPLTDNAKRIALFQMAFPNAARESGRVPAPGVDNLRATLSLAQASQGSPTGVLGAAASNLGKPLRSYILSNKAQNRYAAFPMQTDSNVASDFARFAAAQKARNP